MNSIEYGAAPRIDSILARAARSEPNRAAVIHDTQRRTYAEVYENARLLAGALETLGVQKGDRIALWTKNRPEFVEVFFGVPMLGAIASPIDFWWGWKDASIALEQLLPRVLIVGAEQADIVIDAGSALRAMGVEHIICLGECVKADSFFSYASLLHAASPLERPVEVTQDDPALILFTSGSTGRSKGSVHTHGGLVATAATMSIELGLKDGERTLHFLPMFSSCLEHLLPLTMMRATHILLSQFDARAVWAAIEESNVTHIDAVPTTLRRLLEVAPAEIPSSLRMISYASERMPDSLISELMERMPDVEFVQFYGMIEHLCLTVLSASDHKRKLGSVGRPMLGAQLRLEADGDKSEGVGEVIAKSPTMFSGYWKDEAATRLVIGGEWMRTGDLGRFDEDGYLFLEGRVKEMIKSGGLTVIPTEVEGTLLEHSDVSDAAVVGLPDTEWGEAVHAFVILSGDSSVQEDDLRAFCRSRLAGYKRPKRIHIVTELPRTGIGKVARNVVREKFMAAGAG